MILYEPIVCQCWVFGWACFGSHLPDLWYIHCRGLARAMSFVVGPFWGDEEQFLCCVSTFLSFIALTSGLVGPRKDRWSCVEEATVKYRLFCLGVCLYTVSPGGECGHLLPLLSAAVEFGCRWSVSSPPSLSRCLVIWRGSIRMSQKGAQNANCLWVRCPCWQWQSPCGMGSVCPNFSPGAIMSVRLSADESRPKLLWPPHKLLRICFLVLSQNNLGRGVWWEVGEGETDIVMQQVMQPCGWNVHLFVDESRPVSP